MDKKYIGHQAQFFDVRQYTLSDGRANGTKAIDVWNGKNLHFTILPDRALDIYSLRYKGNNMSYLTSQGIVNPKYYNECDNRWLRVFGGGFFVTCGLKNIGGIGPDDKANTDITLHGRISNIPAENVCVELLNDGMSVRISGIMRESMLYGSNFTLKRTMEINYGEDTINFTDEIKNHAYKTYPISMLYHFNMGYPLMDTGAKLCLPTKNVIPCNERGKEDLKTWDQVYEPSDDYPQVLFFHELEEKWFGFDNDKINTRMRVYYSSPILDHFLQWKVCESGTYVTGLEPSTCTGNGRAKAIEDGTQKYIGPGETIINKFEISFTELN